jgi:hypothetical protein
MQHANHLVGRTAERTKRNGPPEGGPSLALPFAV